MSLKLKSSGGGSVTFADPASTASDFTLNLPLQNGTVVASDSSGNVGIGTNSPSRPLSVSAGSGYNVATFTASGPETNLNISNTGTNGRSWGIIAGGNGGSFSSGQFGIYDATAAAPRLAIDSSGNLLVGTTSLSLTPTTGIVVEPTGAGGGTTIGIGHASGTATGNYYMAFAYNGSAIGSITQSGTTNIALNGTSDYRIKQNVRDADVKSFHKIQFHDFEWIDGRHDCGVIAHELKEVYPDLVLGEKDAVDEEGNPVHQQVNYLGLIPRMGAMIQKQQQAIQEQQAIIADLKTRIETLEAK